MLIKQKLRLIYQGEAFNGKPTKTARSHGKKFQVSVRQETSKLLVGTYHCNFNLPTSFSKSYYTSCWIFGKICFVVLLLISDQYYFFSVRQTRTNLKSRTK